jgi:probable F420-dependent oxidoreductase
MPTTRPFRFGVSLWAGATAAEWSAKGQKAEDLGFDIALVPDHVAPIFPPMVALMAIAAATSHIRVGTMVLNNDFRHPVLLAREAATLDLLSGGRFELGMGAGHAAEEYAGLGLRYDLGQVRVARLAEAIGIIQPLLAGREVSFTGTHYQVAVQRIFPEPVQRPIPLFIGGNSKGVLELAARLADIVGFTGFFSTSGGGQSSRVTHFSQEGFANRLNVVRLAAGERFGSLELNTLIQSVSVAAGPAAAAEAVSARMPSLSPQAVLESPFLLAGTAGSIVETLERRREAFGLSYVTVFEPYMEALAPVVAQLAGT